MDVTRDKLPTLFQCHDINECMRADVTKCLAGNRCVNTRGSFYCECRQGFKRDAAECVDLDECEEGTFTCGVAESCVNSLGTYSCECSYGWTRDGLGKCINYNECITNTHDCVNSHCIDTEGSFICNCFSGLGSLILILVILH